MQSLKHFFSYLNDIDFPYVVLRNFENLPEIAYEGEHNDIDLLVYDREHFEEIIPQAIKTHRKPRVRYKMKVNEDIVYLDVRYVGDGYYPKMFEMNILDSREWDNRGFYKPNPVHFRIALSYHAVHHKNKNNYHKYLGDVSVDDLLIALQNSNIGYVIPKDPTVGKFNQYWKGATSLVKRSDGSIEKIQKSFTEFNLIENEARILNKLDSKHFPKVIRNTSKSIEIEDCGERLNVHNLPNDWEDQLIEIILDLKKFQVQHRDIKPDNLMIKDGIIKLIDFGWSRFYSDDPDTPPECLGYPYKPTWGWDDDFSMRKIMKEFQYTREEMLL